MARGCHRIDDDRSLLPLKFVDGAYVCAGDKLLQPEDLGIIRSDDQDMVASTAAASTPTPSTTVTVRPPFLRWSI